MINYYLFSSILFFLLSSVFLFLYSSTRKFLKERSEISQAIWKIDQVILNTLDFAKVIDGIVNEALTELSEYGYVILVLSLIDEQKGVLKRISLSRTEEAAAALKFSPIPFKSIEIPIGALDNLNIKVIQQKKALDTRELSDLLVPVIDPKLSSAAQQAAGIKVSVVYPVSVRGKILGTLIFSTKKESRGVMWYEREIMSGFVDAVGIAIENSSLFQKLQDTTLQLEKANIRLKELDQLKNDFVSVTSHELRTPMTAIRSYAWMALHMSDIAVTPKMDKYLTRVLVSTERLINLVNDMLNVSRIESGKVETKPEIFDIRYLVNEVVTEISPKAQENLLKINVSAEQPPSVFADIDKVHQVLLNLLGNSLKFTPHAGSINIGFFTDGVVVETSIKDSGVGISKDDLSRLFTKFGRLDNSYVATATSGGTGLGLYITKSLVELMGGKIWASSAGAGKGATFTFSLPIASREVLANADKYTHLVEEPKPLEPAIV